MNEGSGAAGIWGMIYCHYDVHLSFIISVSLPPTSLPLSLRAGTMCYSFLYLSHSQECSRCPMDIFE